MPPGAFLLPSRLTRYERLDLVLGSDRTDWRNDAAVSRGRFNYRRRRLLVAPAGPSAPRAAAAPDSTMAEPDAKAAATLCLRPSRGQLRKSRHPHHRPGRDYLRGPGIL